MNLDSRLMILGLLVALVGAVLTCTLIEGADKTEPFYVAASDLPRGRDDRRVAQQAPLRLPATRVIPQPLVLLGLAEDQQRSEAHG